MSNPQHSVPSGFIPTPIGNINYTMTAADHVYLRTESANDEAITVYRVRYHCCFHCYLVDGKWTAKDWQEPYLSRKGTGGPSPAARKAARALLAKAWTEFLAAHPDLSRQAALASAEEGIEKLAEEVRELEVKLHAKRAELRTARKHFAAS